MPRRLGHASLSGPSSLAPLSPPWSLPKCAVGRVHGAPRPPYLEALPSSTLASPRSSSSTETSQASSLSPSCFPAPSMAGVPPSCPRTNSSLLCLPTPANHSRELPRPPGSLAALQFLLSTAGPPVSTSHLPPFASVNGGLAVELSGGPLDPHRARRGSLRAPVPPVPPTVAGGAGYRRRCPFCLLLCSSGRREMNLPAGPACRPASEAKPLTGGPRPVKWRRVHPKALLCRVGANAEYAFDVTSVTRTAVQLGRPTAISRSVRLIRVKPFPFSFSFPDSL